MVADWFADPSGSHEYRWWDGTVWTTFVADRGVLTDSPVPAFFPPPDSAASPDLPTQENSPMAAAPNAAPAAYMWTARPAVNPADAPRPAWEHNSPEKSHQPGTSMKQGTTDRQRASTKHRQSGFALVVLGLIAALFWVPLGVLILAGIGELMYAMSLREPASPSTLTDQLNELDMLRSQGRIDDSEHARVRAQLLGGSDEAPRDTSPPTSK